VQRHGVYHGLWPWRGSEGVPCRLRASSAGVDWQPWRATRCGWRCSRCSPREALRTGVRAALQELRGPVRALPARRRAYRGGVGGAPRPPEGHLRRVGDGGFLAGDGGGRGARPRRWRRSFPAVKGRRPRPPARIGADGRGRPEGKRAAPLAGTALVVGSLAFFLFDTEGARAWFALPYGGAWVMVGCLLLRSGGAGAAPRPPRLR
jgi:hypothetical protein